VRHLLIDDDFNAIHRPDARERDVVWTFVHCQNCTRERNEDGLVCLRVDAGRQQEASATDDALRADLEKLSTERDALQAECRMLLHRVSADQQTQETLRSQVSRAQSELEDCSRDGLVEHKRRTDLEAERRQLLAQMDGPKTARLRCL